MEGNERRQALSTPPPPPLPHINESEIVSGVSLRGVLRLRDGKLFNENSHRGARLESALAMQEASPLRPNINTGAAAALFFIYLIISLLFAT